MARLCFGLLFLCLWSGLASAAQDVLNSAISVRQADRSVDVVTQLVKINTQLVFENSGKEPVKHVLYAVEPRFKDALSYIVANLVEGKATTPLRVSKISLLHGDSGNAFFKVDLREPLTSGRTVTISVETVLAHHLIPYPAEIAQREKQLVIYHGNHYIYSPYPVMKQTTRVILSSRNVENYSKLKPVSQSDSTITYGPYEKIAPLSDDPMLIHYENNSPFLTIRSLQRAVEVSHWGNIAIEETLDLQHTGAKLKGPFSRYEYQRESQSGLSSIKNFKTILPASATDVYYRDEIGNISTSNMRVLGDSVELDLRPRFPLFGDWRTHYVIGYNVPSYEYLFNSGDQYLLKFRFIDHVYDDMVIDEAITKIILPEGCHNIQVKTPYEIERLPDSLHYTYLDTKGRPVVTLRKRNLVENHIQELEVRYQFPRMLMLQEPLLVVLALYLLFLLVIVYVRLDFSISKDEASENRLRIAGHIEKIRNHHGKRMNTYDALDEQLNRLKTSKDLNSFNSALKTISNDYKNETQHIADVLAKLKADGPEVAEKISELQKADKALKEVSNQQQALYVDKLVPGKINRSAFLEQDGALNKKKAEYIEKINGIVKSLQH